MISRRGGVILFGAACLFIIVVCFLATMFQTMYDGARLRRGPSAWFATSRALYRAAYTNGRNSDIVIGGPFPSELKCDSWIAGPGIVDRRFAYGCKRMLLSDAAR